MLIGLAGTAGAGKDTVFGMLQDIHAENDSDPASRVRREAFADRLKISAAAALGFDGSDEERIAIMNKLKTQGWVTTECSEGDLTSISVREYLQRYGTEAHRDVFDTDFWMKAVLPDDWQPDPFEMLVITDVRFPNEAQRIRDYGGVIWEIVRVAQINETSHASEQALPRELVDTVIMNTGTLEELRDEVILANRGLEVRVA